VYVVWISGQSSAGTLLWRWQYFSTFEGTSHSWLSVFYGVVTSIVVALGARVARVATLPWAFTKGSNSNVLSAFSVGAFFFGCLAILALASPFGNEQWFLEAATIAVAVPAAAGAHTAVLRMRLQGLTSGPMSMAVACSIVVAGATQWLLTTSLVTTRPFLIPILAVVAALIGALGCYRVARTDIAARATLAVTTLTAVILFGSGIAFGGIRLAAEWHTQNVGVPLTPILADAGGGGIDRPETPEQSTQMSDAALWLRAHAEDSDIVAIPGHAAAFIPAISGLRGYATGEFEATKLGPAGSLDLFRARQGTLEEYLSQQSPELHDRLCRDGVRWLWIPRPWQPRPSGPEARVRYSNSAGDVVELLCTRTLASSIDTPR
ncbi:MAG: hypothetical protein WCI74_20415, partial [Actinomycetes bacterium]